MKTPALSITSLILLSTSLSAVQARDGAPITPEESRESERSPEVSDSEYHADASGSRSLLVRGTNTSQNGTAQPDEIEALRQELRQTNRRLDDLTQRTSTLNPGESGFHVAGFAFTRLVVPDKGDSVLTTGIAPIILWKIDERFLFETEFELTIVGEDGRAETELELEYANLQYLVNDRLAVGVGKFLTPFGLFSERLHPAWINKLPNSPLVRAHGGLAPMSSMGAFMRGAAPIGKQRVNYAVFLTMGPSVVSAATDPDEYGELNFEAFNDNPAVGGRIGYLPIPQVELGYSMLYGKADSNDGLKANALLMGLDASYVTVTKAGLVDLRFEYVYSSVDDVIFDADGSVGVGPTTYKNNRDGLYAQAAFRPIHSGSDFLKNIEIVGRYDYMKLPDDAPEGGTRTRWTGGVNYWFNPSTVLKLAIDDADFEGEERTQSFMMMVAVGF